MERHMVDGLLERLRVEPSEELAVVGAEPAAQLETLGRLQSAFLRAVPFENQDIHDGRPMDISLAATYSKVVERHRGGLCFELNTLFADLLLALGFDEAITPACTMCVSARPLDIFRHPPYKSTTPKYPLAPILHVYLYPAFVVPRRYTSVLPSEACSTRGGDCRLPAQAFASHSSGCTLTRCQRDTQINRVQSGRYTDRTVPSDAAPIVITAARYTGYPYLRV